MREEIAPSCCRSGVSRRRSSVVGTCLRLAAGLMFCAAGASAARGGGSAAATAGQPGGSGEPQKYSGVKRAVIQMKKDYARWRETKTVIKELGSTPPKPLQVFEYGPSRITYLLDPKKYKYQYVCVVSRMGTVEEGIWHRRKAPVTWWRVPPFHVRIVRPNPAGMLDYMLTKKKIRLAQKDVTITKRNKRTGRIEETVTRPMTVLERPEESLPKHLKQRLKAEREGNPWKDTRATVGRWGPTPDEEFAEKEVMALLAEAGIEGREEAEKVFKRVDDHGKEYDIRPLLRFAKSAKGKKTLRRMSRKDKSGKGK